jgi:hypothetical protein
VGVSTAAVRSPNDHSVCRAAEPVRLAVSAPRFPPWCTIDGYLAARRRRHTGRLHDQLRRWQASGQQGGDTSAAAGAGRIEAGPVVRGGPELSTPRTCPNPRCPASRLGLGSPAGRSISPDRVCWERQGRARRRPYAPVRQRRGCRRVRQPAGSPFAWQRLDSGDLRSPGRRPHAKR